jgi:hypothetical protein
MNVDSRSTLPVLSTVSRGFPRGQIWPMQPEQLRSNFLATYVQSTYSIRAIKASRAREKVTDGFSMSDNPRVQIFAACTAFWKTKNQLLALATKEQPKINFPGSTIGPRKTPWSPQLLMSAIAQVTTRTSGCGKLHRKHGLGA